VGRYTKDSFNSSYRYTISVDLAFRSIDVDGQQLLLEIWDTAGQESLRKFVSLHIFISQGILLVYDVTNERSFRSKESLPRRARPASK